MTTQLQVSNVLPTDADRAWMVAFLQNQLSLIGNFDRLDSCRRWLRFLGEEPQEVENPYEQRVLQMRALQRSNGDT